MLVGRHGQQASPVDPLLEEKLTAGKRLKARVLSVTRNVLSVSIGQDTFQLTMPSKPSDAKTLTLQAVGSLPMKDGNVRIVAQDERPLAQPILAKLISSTPPAPSAVSTIIQKGELEVRVAPLNSEGKVAGSSLSVRLQTVTFPDNAGTHLGGPKTDLDQVKTTPLEGSGSGSTPAPQLTKSPLSLPNQLAPEGSAGTLPEAAPASSNRVIERTDPAGLTSHQAFVDEPSKVEQPGVRPMEERSAMKSEPKAGMTASLIASAASVLSGIKQAIVDGKAVQYAQGSAPSPRANGNLLAEGATSSKGMATASPLVQQAHGNARSLESSPQASSSGILKAGHDRGLTTSAVVVARSPADRLVLEAKGQLFKVEQPLDLPTGTTLQATFFSIPTAMAEEGRAAGLETRATLLNQLISILDEIDQASRYETRPGDPEPRRQLPQPDRHLASRFLNLLSLEEGTAADGDHLSAPRQSVPTDAQRDQIQGLLRDLRGMSAEPSTEGWKATTLPLGHDPGQSVMLFLREQPLDPDDHRAVQDTEPDQIQRAVFDLSLSELGRCQIDVLCQTKRFDFLMRSDNVLPSQDQQAISVLFRSACEIAGVTGEINFKTGDFFEPTTAPIPPSKDVVT
jgi:hypothetical protein